MRQVLNISEKEAMECMENLKEEYEENARGIRIRKVKKGFQSTDVIINPKFELNWLLLSLT